MTKDLSQLLFSEQVVQQAVRISFFENSFSKKLDKLFLKILSYFLKRTTSVATSRFYLTRSK
ncbi:hypothetical protein RV03_GL001685 [Enterococcus gallinarum]|nr:hypothetical protein RV03_GL001685 [Enterococcus gallinarum]